MERAPAGVFALALAAGALGLTALGYAHVLDYGLTDKDTLMHVTEGRVAEPADLARLLVTPLTGGRSPVDANFYRPTMMLAYAGLRAAFGWSPRGYHAVDLLLHALCGVLAALFAAACARRAGLRAPRRFGVLCGGVLLVHPLGVEIVPAIARNADLVVTAASLAALLALDRAVDRPGAARVAAFTALFAVAIGAKEPGLLLGVTALLYAAWLCRAPRRVPALLAPALGVAVAFVALRARVLGDARGGYPLEISSAFLTLAVPNWMLVDLGVPGFAHRLPGLLPGLLFGPALVLAAAALAALLLAARAAVHRRGRPGLRLAVFALAVLAAHAALFVATGTYERRYLYTALPYACLLPALLFARAADALSGRGPHGVRGAALLAAAALAAALLALQSPLIHRYDEWRQSGEATRLLTEDLRASWEALPDGANVMIANLPSGFATEPMRRVTGADVSSTNSPAAGGIAAWLEDQLPHKRFHLRPLGYYRYREPLAGFRHRLARKGRWVEFDRPRGDAQLETLFDDASPFHARRVGERRVALMPRRGAVDLDVYLLVFDGAGPVFVPVGPVRERPRPGSRSSGPGTGLGALPRLP